MESQRSSTLKVALLAGAFGSAAFGLGYAVLYALPALTDAAARGANLLVPFSHLLAALGFAIAQGVAGLLALRDRPAFIVWLEPAAAYLLMIGLVGWLRTGDLVPLWLDAARGLVLGVVGYAQLRALRAARMPS